LFFTTYHLTFFFKRMKKIIFDFILLLVTLSGVEGSLLIAQDTSNGIVWYPPVQISPDGIPCYAPIITTQGKVIHITWKFSDGPLRFPYKRSTDGGKNFDTLRELVSVPNLLSNTDYHLLTASNSRLYGAWVLGDTSAHYQIKFFQSNDSGKTWTPPFTIIDSSGGWLFYESLLDTLLLGTSKQNDYRRIYRSTNRGQTWMPTSLNIGYYASPTVAMVPGKVFLAYGWGYDSVVCNNEFVVQYRTSSDICSTWSNSLPLSTVCPRSGQQAYTPIITSGYDNDTPRVVVSWKDTKYGCLGWGFCSIMERHLTDVQTTKWSPEQTMTDVPRGVHSANAILNSLIAVSWAEEIPVVGDASYQVVLRVSKDKGVSWSVAMNLTPDTTLNAGTPAIAITENTIHVVWEQAPYNGIGLFRIYYRRGEILPTSVKENPSEPVAFELEQNYPNPFNPQTAIGFSLLAVSDVTLKVYNIYGQEVATLIHNRLMDEGIHKVEWNAETFPSGLYFYRLVVKDKKGKTSAATKRMILMK